MTSPKMMNALFNSALNILVKDFPDRFKQNCPEAGAGTTQKTHAPNYVSKRLGDMPTTD
jgi:hypothetical protein